MNNVTVKTQLDLSCMTAEDWQLYRSKEGVDKAATAMSKLMEINLNRATSPTEASHVGYQVLQVYQQYGATDTEPLAVLDRLVHLRFPTWNR